MKECLSRYTVWNGIGTHTQIPTPHLRTLPIPLIWELLQVANSYRSGQGGCTYLCPKSNTCQGGRIFMKKKVSGGRNPSEGAACHSKNGEDWEFMRFQAQTCHQPLLTLTARITTANRLSPVFQEWYWPLELKLTFDFGGLCLHLLFSVSNFSCHIVVA